LEYDFTFYLGTDRPKWLWNGEAQGPLFISIHTLRRKSKYPRATVPFGLDSGGFTHLLKHGRWTVSPREYVDDVMRIHVETGRMSWAAIQDWICAPPVLEKTGQDVLEHQKRTLESWHELRRLAPRIPWAPILQGWHPDDYLRHVEMYEDAGTDLAELDVVGVGSIAQRQTSERVVRTLQQLHDLGINLHGFGIKLEGVRKSLPYLKSSDSMAWSWHARLNGGDRHGQPDGEAYRRKVMDEVRKMEEYVNYEGIFEFFGGDS
jgi:hypothetical protein